MGFNATDAFSLNQARDKHFSPIGIDVEDPQHFMLRITVGKVVTIDRPAEILSNAMMSAMRAYNHSDSTTVWLDVTGDQIPAFVTEAIERCVGFGLGLVVTHGQSCSHLPGLELPGSLLSALDRAQRGGRVWHPVAGRLVGSRLQRPKP